MPYSMLPAQFLGFSAAAHANAREAEDPAIAAVMSFIKVLLFIARVPGGGLAPCSTGIILLSSASRKKSGCAVARTS